MVLTRMMVDLDLVVKYQEYLALSKTKNKTHLMLCCLLFKYFVSIYPSAAHEPGMIQIPISGNNTGSLPDLTNVDFSSPIHTPLDQDQDSSPYSSVSLRIQKITFKIVPLDYFLNFVCVCLVT